MPDSGAPPVEDSYLAKVTEAFVRVALVVLLIFWCFNIIRPFLTPIVWGIILAVAAFPGYRWLTAKFDGRGKVAAAVFAALGFAVVLVPVILFAGSLVESGQQFSLQQELRSFDLSTPPAEVKNWPLVGKTIDELWSQAGHGLEPLLVKFAPQLRAGAMWLVGATVGTGLAIAQSLLSIVIAAVMLAGASGGAQVATRISTRLAGPSGERIVRMAAKTIRSVAVGIVGVAIIQAGLIGIGLLAVGVPHAGVWALVALILAVLQITPMLVVLPAVFYVFSHASTPVAVAFLIWEVAAAMSDNFLKPILLARGVEVPMLVIFMGAIGGFIMSGFVGLFIGAVILSLGYELASAWIQGEVVPSESVEAHP